jgi:hypothetical protein
MKIVWNTSCDNGLTWIQLIFNIIMTSIPKCIVGLHGDVEPPVSVKDRNGRLSVGSVKSNPTLARKREPVHRYAISSPTSAEERKLNCRFAYANPKSTTWGFHWSSLTTSILISVVFSRDQNAYAIFILRLAASYLELRYTQSYVKYSNHASADNLMSTMAFF